jgi:acetyltransferase-like isoleucine patch superfamily enzyme
MSEKTTFIHPNAIVESESIGHGTRIYAFVHILQGAVIGSDCNINDHCFVENDVVLGDRVTVKCGNYLWDGLQVEDDVFLGPNVVYTNDLRPRSKQYPEAFESIRIRQGASIGANSVLLGGITVGEYAMIGMGSVVTRDVPPYTLVYGNPARLHGYVCRCGKALEVESITKEVKIGCICGRTYFSDPTTGHLISKEAE